MKNSFELSYENIRKYSKKGVILDTKPLTLFLCGKYNKETIGQNKISNEFQKEDLIILQKILQFSSKIIITPHILTEVSNRINKIPKEEFKKFMKEIIIHLIKTKEIIIKKEEILNKKETERLGITDVGIILACEKEKRLVITSDGDLERELLSRNLPAINFHRLQQESWKYQKYT